MTTMVIILLVALVAAAVCGFIYFRTEKTPAKAAAPDPALAVKAAIGECRAVADDLDSYGRREDYRGPVGIALLQLADIIREIADNMAKDSRDLSVAQGLVDHHLEKLVELVTGYDTLKTRAEEGEEAKGLEAAEKAIIGVVPHFEVIRKACLENDTNELEIQAKVLKSILDFEVPTHGVKA